VRIMKKRLLTILLILVVFATGIFILTYRTTSPSKEKEKLFIVADSLKFKNSNYRSKLNLLSQLVNSLYLSREYSYDRIAPQNYYVGDRDLYKNVNDGLASVFYTGDIPVGDNLIRDVVLLEQIDEYLQKVYVGDPCIESVFYYDNSDFYRYYPYIEYKKEYRKNNFRETTQYAYIMENISKYGTTWINTPYVSPYTGKWIISVAKPVIQTTTLLGFCMINISVERLNEYIDSVDDTIGILNPEGLCLHPDFKMKESNEQSPWITGEAISDTLTVYDYSIAKSRGSAFKTLADKILKQRDFFYSQKIYNNDYLVITHEMPSMNIFLYTLLHDDGSVAKVKRLRRRIIKAKLRRQKEGGDLD